MQRFYMIFQNISNMRKLYFTLCTQSHICDFIHRVFSFVILLGGTDMAVGTEEGDLAVKILDEYMKEFQIRNPTLRVFSCHLHLDESTPHLHVDFVPYVTGWEKEWIQKFR